MLAQGSLQETRASVEAYAAVLLPGSLDLTAVPTNHTDLERRLWEADDELRADSKLKSSDHPGRKEDAAARQRTLEDRHDRLPNAGIVYTPEKARFGNLLNVPEGTDIGKATVDCMDRSV